MNAERLVGALLLATVAVWAVGTAVWIAWAERREARVAAELAELDAWLASLREASR